LFIHSPYSGRAPLPLKGAELVEAPVVIAPKKAAGKGKRGSEAPSRVVVKGGKHGEDQDDMPLEL
jgi:hypothetical protein